MRTVEEALKGLPHDDDKAAEILELIASKEEETRRYYLRPFDSSEIYNMLIEIHGKRGEPEMVDRYRRCLDLRQARKWTILGDSYALMGLTSRAVEYLERALFFGPSEDLIEEVENTLKKAEKRAGKAGDEVDRLLSRLEKDPDNTKLIVKASVALIDLDRLEDALKLLNRGLRKNKDDPDMLYRKGCALFGMGEFSKALRIFKKLTEANPKSNNYKRAYNLSTEMLG